MKKEKSFLKTKKVNLTKVNYYYAIIYEHADGLFEYEIYNKNDEVIKENGFDIYSYEAALDEVKKDVDNFISLAS